MQWAVDQQPYLQGYESVDSLWLYLTNGNVLGGGLTVLTGPAFIDSQQRRPGGPVREPGHPLTVLARGDAPPDPRHGGLPAPRTSRPLEREVFMTQIAEAPVTPPPIRDERVGRKSLLARLLARPEAGALVGAIVIYVFFFIIAPPFRSAASFSSVLYVTSTYGLMATPIALLMIGGEFDLSAGVSVTSSALCASLFSYEFTTNAWVGVLVGLGLALFIGFLNGWIVVKTGIPSFLVTLGTFFMLQGMNIALTQTITNQVASPDISTLQGFSSAREVFSGSFTIGGVNIRTAVIYWIVFVAIATWILLRTRIGNWIFSVGGSRAVRPGGGRAGGRG